MPIVTIECVHAEEPKAHNETIVQNLANELGKAFGSKPGSTWVRLRYLDRAAYAENETSLSPETEPTFVNVLVRSLPNETEIQRLASDIARVTAHALDRPLDNTHVIFEPEGFGRVAFGGNLVTKDSL